MGDFRIWKDGELQKLKGDLDEMYDSLCCKLGLAESLSLKGELADLEIIEEKSAWILRVRLAFVPPDTVYVALTADTMIIFGRGFSEDSEEYVNFRNSFSLPVDCDIRLAEVKFAEGALWVHLPRIEVVDRIEFEVSTADEH